MLRAYHEEKAQVIAAVWPTMSGSLWSLDVGPELGRRPRSLAEAGALSQ